MEVRRKGKLPSIETRYFISSLDPDELLRWWHKVSASQFQDLILRHWEVENCLHLQKDRYFEEDKHVVKCGWGQTWTILTNIAVSLTRWLRKNERTLREVHENCHANPKATAKRLGYRS